jgi:hypothetical protein
MHQQMLCYWLWLLANTNTSVLPRPPLAWPQQTFLFPKLKSTLKGLWVKRLWNICGWSYAWFWKRHTRTVSRSNNRIGEWCISAGGEYFEGSKAHSVAGMSEKIMKRIVQNFLSRPHTYV